MGRTGRPVLQRATPSPCYYTYIASSTTDDLMILPAERAWGMPPDSPNALSAYHHTLALPKRRGLGGRTSLSNDTIHWTPHISSFSMSNGSCLSRHRLYIQCWLGPKVRCRPDPPREREPRIWYQLGRVCPTLCCTCSAVSPGFGLNQYDQQFVLEQRWYRHDLGPLIGDKYS